MDFTSMSFAIIAAVVSAIGLWWHIILAKKGLATGRDRALGVMWVALIVLSLGRILWIASHGKGESPSASPTVPAVVVPDQPALPK